MKAYFSIKISTLFKFHLLNLQISNQLWQFMDRLMPGMYEKHHRPVRTKDAVHSSY